MHQKFSEPYRLIPVQTNKKFPLRPMRGSAGSRGEKFFVPTWVAGKMSLGSGGKGKTILLKWGISAQSRRSHANGIWFQTALLWR